MKREMYPKYEEEDKFEQLDDEVAQFVMRSN